MTTPIVIDELTEELRTLSRGQITEFPRWAQ